MHEAHGIDPKHSLFALAWDSPQTVSDDELAQLREGYIRKLAALHTILPERFHAVVQECIDNVDHVLSLPLVFAHQDLSLADIIVDKSSHLTGIVSWAQAHVSPFGSNLHALQLIAGKMHPQNGYFKYDDYLELSGAFWSTLQEKVGTLSKETLHTIKLAMHTSLLISRSFTSDNVPIGDDAEGRYNLLFLDAFVLA